jgi:hypothetical protein
LDISNLHTKCGIAHIKILLKECYCCLLMGQLARMSLEGTKVEIGVSGLVFSQSFWQLGTLATNGFVKHTWQFLSENGFTIEDQVGDLKLRRCRDVFLMEAFILHGIKGKALLRMNMCCKFLQVEMLLDITMADGRYITWSVQHGRWNSTLPEYHWWPKQGDPGECTWEEWRRTLAIVFCGGNLAHGLLQPLGPWFDCAPEDWQWWYSLTEEWLY